MPSAAPSPTSQSPDVGGSRPPGPGHRLLDQCQALIETVAAVDDIGLLKRGGDHRVARTYDVAPAKFDSAHADAARQLVHCGFDGEVGLRQAVAAKRAAGHRVGVDHVGVDLLVVAAIDGNGFAAGMMQHGPAVIAVGAGVGQDAHLHRRQGAVAPRSGLDAHPHGMTRRGADELFFARELELDGLFRS